MVGFEGPGVPGWLDGHLRRRSIAGVILFSRNFESFDHARELVAELRRTWPEVLIGIDQEGGRVQRLRAPFPELPPMAQLGATGREDLALETGDLIGTALRQLGIDLDFAPVLDVATRPDNPVIGDRAFHADAERVARLGSAFIRGLQRRGVAACGKHFPGHGDTDADSHHTLPHVDVDRDRLEQREWVPFVRAIADGVASIMTAHVVVDRLDPVPATRSRFLLRDVLRDDLGFRGVVVSDDLEMAGFGDPELIGDHAVTSVRAGCDVLLVCRRQERVEQVLRSLTVAGEQDRAFAARLDEAEGRRASLRRRFAPPIPVRDIDTSVWSQRRDRLVAAWPSAVSRAGVDPELDPTRFSDQESTG
jgi:beta-N-acetylhexosaminidase